MFGPFGLQELREQRSVMHEPLTHVLGRDVRDTRTDRAVAVVADPRRDVVGRAVMLHDVRMVDGDVCSTLLEGKYCCLVVTCKAFLGPILK